jgi:hypothetical protein
MFNNLMTTKQFVAENPCFTMGSLRNILFYADANGLEAIGAIKRCGRKILIDAELFFCWLDKNPSITGNIKGA